MVTRAVIAIRKKIQKKFRFLAYISQLESTNRYSFPVNVLGKISIEINLKSSEEICYSQNICSLLTFRASMGMWISTLLRLSKHGLEKEVREMNELPNL